MNQSFIQKIPKAELHLHIEGSLEPELMFKLAKRNKIKIPYKSVAALKKAYQFANLQEFLDIYYQGASVLIKKKDFYDMTIAYFQKVKLQGIMHAELFFDPQTHTDRGISFATVIEGIHDGFIAAKKKYGITSKLILCFLRHLDEQAAMETLKAALPYKKWITAVGLDSSEIGHPPSKFKKVYAQARKAGFLTVAHAGEEGPASYIWEALKLLKVSRIDHGNRCLDDPKLVKKLIALQMPLTMCPLSNLKLCVVKDLKKHPLKKMLDMNLKVMINSDDPAYFGGYIGENYIAIQKALDLSKEDLFSLAKNSIDASFASENRKREMQRELKKYME